MSRDYSRLDQGIIDHIVAYPEFGPCNSSVLRQIAKQIAPRCQPDRLIDRRTQRLRKDGRITYSKKRWRLA